MLGRNVVDNFSCKFFHYLEQFIRAKYDREEFKDISKQEGYSQGSKTGSLFKKGKDNDR